MWNDQMQHICDGCGKDMQASDIGDTSTYDLCNDCCNIENDDELMLSDGDCADCGKWSTIEVQSGLCGICLKIRDIES